MTQILSFMPNSVKALRTMLNGIMGSYDNPWDLLAELSQNAVDAIRTRGLEQGNVKFRFDPEIATITITDTGTGINPNGAADLFSPFGTNKDNDFDAIGEKGVGLKYVIFSSRKFKLTSHHNHGSFEVVVNGAADWLRSRTNEDFGFTLTKIQNHEAKIGTEIEVQLDDAEHPLFELSFKQIKTLLLTKTAIGSTRPIWKNGNNEKFNATLILKPLSKSEQSETFKAQYLLPTDVLTKHVSIDAFDDWRMNSNPTDAQKRTFLKHKIVFDEGIYNSSGRDIRYWSCMMPSSDQFFVASKKYGLVGDDDQENYSKELNFYAFHPDVTLSTKGMPTTVSLDFQPKGDAGYRIQFFTIIEDDRLEFDIGRKGASVGPRTIGMYKKITQTQFSKMLRFKRFLRGDAGKKVDRFLKRDLFNEIDSLPNLESERTSFLKRPNKQEATIAAIFYELMGKGTFDNFRPYVSGYRDTYDLTGKINGDDLILEFKYELTALFKDFSSLNKMFDDIDVVVIWELTEQDRKKVKDSNVLLTAIEEGDRTLFPIAHYIMQTDNARDMEILELRKLVE